MEQQHHKLKLMVGNPTEMGSGLSREHIFGIRGGSIGTARNDTWQLSSHRTGVVAGHAEIRFTDGEFCLIDRSGRTYINSANQPVGRGRRARLKNGDTITVGRYKLKAELFAGAREPGELLEREQAEDVTLVDVAEGELARATPKQRVTDAAEPLTGLQPAPGTPGEMFSNDPMDGWQPARASGEGQEPLLASKPDQSRQHISGAPLLRGMEAELNFADSDEMRLFLEEAGQTLKATVDGLLALHQGEDSRHRALRTRLQPIEDNPLRLGQDYDDTVQTLFASQRSPVHLSAPAAVSESLQSLHHHQLATQTAIREALDAILHAFSPEALLRRFHGYRRGLKSNEDEGHWAWQMYQHYYRELSSSRQQGFERLFQEVFDQAYDQHLRQLQRENLS